MTKFYRICDEDGFTTYLYTFNIGEKEFSFKIKKNARGRKAASWTARSLNFRDANHFGIVVGNDFRTIDDAKSACELFAGERK